MNGTIARPDVAGVVITGGASKNIVGGNVAVAGNLISGNSGDGVLITGAKTKSNLVMANSIGLARASTPRCPTWTASTSGPRRTAIRSVGRPPAAANLISGNAVYGVHLEGANTTANLIQGNTIGLNGTSTGAVANFSGVGIDNAAPGNTIDGNTIAGEQRFGIHHLGVGTTANVISSNRIGTSAAGSAIANFEGSTTFRATQR